MFFALLARFSRSLSKTTKNWSVRLRAKCSHPKVRYVMDAHDYEFFCCYCDKRWLNEVPKLVRSFFWFGRRYKIDGSGRGIHDFVD